MSGCLPGTGDGNSDTGTDHDTESGDTVEDDGATVVFVVEDGRVERRAVRAGRRDSGEVVIVSGLSARESVVADVAGGETGLADGDRVKVIDTGAG